MIEHGDVINYSCCCCFQGEGRLSLGIQYSYYTIKNRNNTVVPSTN